MAGLYIHIPFCRDACNYCDFHFSISLVQLEPMLEAIEKEIKAEKNFLEGEELDTIYLGGGTPSVMETEQVERIFKAIRKYFIVKEHAEITLEANPDDLNPVYLSSLRQTGINRLSIGIQSFHDGDLEFMKRGHDSRQSKACLEYARKAGFDNLNLDLIYGLPVLNNEKWMENLEIALKYRPTHLAAYHLTYEQGTVLDYRRRKGKIVPLDENRSLDHYNILCERMEKHGYQHYEISNFALPGFISKHNSAYWKGEKYLGIGPSAHSFNGNTRRWNISGNASYMKRIMEGNRVHEEEMPDNNSRFHDYLMTSLRTMWGVDIEHIRREWGEDYYRHILKHSAPYTKSGKISSVGGKLILTREGMFISDHIIRELFL